MSAPARDQILQVEDESPHRAVAAVERLRRDDRLQGAEDGERPAAQRAALLVRHAEQVADDFDRDGRGEVLDQVDLAVSAPAIRRRTRLWSGGSLNTRLVV